MRYTLGQFRAYLDRADRRDRVLWRRQMIAGRMAMADQDQANKLLSALADD